MTQQITNDLFTFICEDYSYHYNEYLKLDYQIHELKWRRDLPKNWNVSNDDLSLALKQAINKRTYHYEEMQGYSHVMDRYFRKLHIDYKSKYPKSGKVAMNFNYRVLKYLDFMDENNNINVEKLWNFVHNI